MVAPDMPAVNAEMTMLKIACFDFSSALSRTYV
jgi:hypothetical protein